jgi:DNA-binding CsgD family transcriptional regulator
MSNTPNGVRLSQAQLRRLLEGIGRIYSRHDLEDFPRQVLQVGREMAPADFAVYDEIEMRGRRHRWVADPPGVELSAPPGAHGSFFAEHPFMQQLRRHGDMTPARLSDFLTRRRYHEKEFYREAYRRFGIEHQLGFTLPHPTPALSAGFAFNRRHRDFSDQERLTFALLRPHLVQACANASVVTRLRDAASGVVSIGSGAPPFAVVTLDARGRIHSCPPEASSWLATFFGQGTDAGGPLPDALRAWVHGCRLPGTRSGSVPGPREPLVVERHGQRLTIRFLSESESGTALALEARRTACSPDALRPLGLTARQAEVLAWIAQGKTNREIGQILGLSPGTVHKHTEHIFTRLGVETRTAAAARAWEVLTGAPGF